MIRGVTLLGKVKGLRPEAEGKPSVNSATQVKWGRPEAKRSNHGQVEADVTVRGGPNRCGLKTALRTCG
jgi:hypothetical protein